MSTPESLQQIGTDWKEVEKRSEPFFKFHSGFFKSRFFLFTTFIQKKLNYFNLLQMFLLFENKRTVSIRPGSQKKLKKSNFFFDPFWSKHVNNRTVHVKEKCGNWVEDNPQNNRKRSDPYRSVANFPEWTQALSEILSVNSIKKILYSQTNKKNKIIYQK